MNDLERDSNLNHSTLFENMLLYINLIPQIRCIYKLCVQTQLHNAKSHELWSNQIIRSWITLGAHRTESKYSFIILSAHIDRTKNDTIPRYTPYVLLGHFLRILKPHIYHRLQGRGTPRHHNFGRVAAICKKDIFMLIWLVIYSKTQRTFLQYKHRGVK